MLLLGCKPPGRHIEQHDVFFGIARSINELVPEIKTFWRGPAKIHIDAWREVTFVDDYKINVLIKDDNNIAPTIQSLKLFFINLGGYQENRFEEQHYLLLTVKNDRAAAYKDAKETLFYQHNHFEGASSHIDDKYGIDVDDLYQIEDILLPAQKEKFRIDILPGQNAPSDKLNLGYLKLSSLV